MTDLESTQQEIEHLQGAIERLKTSIRNRFLGQEQVMDSLLLCLLADGHVLLEGAPGLGKTTLVRALSDSLALKFRRVQFTPDLMPPDILGSRMLEMDAGGGRHFSFELGPIFTNVLLADEINRATPRTQSALLEAMQEHQVTLFGETRALEDPFVVIATQNPIEMEGTYPLPEAQLDRFLLKIELEMPDRDDLTAILEATSGAPAPAIEPVLNADEVRRLRALVRSVPVAREVVQFVSDLILATHPAPGAPERIRTFVRHGASPRGGQAILMCAKARALLRGHLHVGLDDVRAIAVPALRHRLLLGYEGEASGVTPDELIEDALATLRP